MDHIWENKVELTACLRHFVEILCKIVGKLKTIILGVRSMQRYGLQYKLMEMTFSITLMLAALLVFSSFFSVFQVSRGSKRTEKTEK